jgi:hypothetical protein
MDALVTELAASGVIVVSRRPPVVCPTEAAVISACTPKDGRIDELVNLSDPDARNQVNDAFLRLASRYGLFGENGDFLLTVNLKRDGIGIDIQWIRVRLADSWDMSGRYSRTICGPSRDGFLAMSLDGEVMISATTYEGNLGSVIALPAPYRAAPIRRAVGYLLDSERIPDEEKAAMRTWLLNLNS